MRAPLPGLVRPLADVPDPVFAQAMVGPGVAIDPPLGGDLTVCAPLAGTVTALHPHAFAIDPGDGGPGVLVHLGLDTITLGGVGFTVLVEKGQEVTPGQEIVRWDTTTIGSLSPLVPVVAVGAAAVTTEAPLGAPVETGDALLRL